jgi:hypothetical protein
MLTGTPLDLTFIPELLQWLGKAIPVAWLVVLVVALAQVWRKSKTAGGRAAGTATVLALAVALPGWGIYKLFQKVQADRATALAQRAEFEARHAKAEALFKKRCETAGETIHKTIPNVKGVVWMKWRESANMDDQFALDDPYGHDCTGDECIARLLSATEGQEFVASAPAKPSYGQKGYEYVEATNPADGLLYRYTLRYYRPQDRFGGGSGWEKGGMSEELVKTPISVATATFGITWDDISSHEDRENWIAGGSLSVVNARTNEIIATRMGYMFDRALGDRSNFRTPWASASTQGKCNYVNSPPSAERHPTDTQNFSFKVLKPSTGE